MRSGILLAVAALLFLCVLPYIAFAAEPTTIALQGKLTNTTTGSLIYSATLRVNISDADGITVWNQTYPNAVSSGFFDLLLGSDGTNPLNLTFNKEYNVSVYIGSSSTPVGGSYKFRSSMGSVSVSNITSGNFSAEGNYSFGSTLFVDKTNGNVGIGTTTPSSKFNVVGGNTILSSGTNAEDSPLSIIPLQVASNYTKTYTGLGNIAQFRSNEASASFPLELRVQHLGNVVSENQALVLQAGHYGADFTANILLNAYGGKVGIGTIAPLSTLHVNGSGDSGGLRVTNDSGYTAFFVNSTSGNIGIGKTNPIPQLSIGIGNAATNNLEAGTTSTFSYVQGFNRSSSPGYSPLHLYGLYVSLQPASGNVGIGTTNPVGKLHIVGTSPDIRIESAVGTQNVSLSFIKTSTKGWSIGNVLQGSSRDFVINDDTNLAGTNRVTFQEGGNVGIGTTSPTATLSVGGNSSADMAFGYDYAGTNNIVKSFAQSHLLSNVPSKLVFGISDGGGVVGVSVENVRDGNFNSQYLNFTTHDGGDSVGTRMVIDKNGNMGIGTASPQAPLHIVGGAGDTLILQKTTSNVPSFKFIGASTNSSIEGGDNFDFYMNSSIKIRIASNGNVGIGTTPVNPLHISKDDATNNGVTNVLRLDHTTSGIPASGIGTGINFVTDAEGGNVAIAGISGISTDVTEGSHKGALTFSTVDWADDGSAERMRIDRDGNVGIGETAPAYKLSVAQAQTSTIGTTVGAVIGNSGAAAAVGNVLQLGFHYNPSGSSIPAAIIGSIFTSTAGYTKSDLIFATRDVTTDTAPTERVRISSDGKVGIGTTAPLANLQIKSYANKEIQIGNTTASYTSTTYFPDIDDLGSIISFSRPENGNFVHSIFAYDTVANAKNQLAVASRNDIIFMSGGTASNKMVLDSNGNVGIGTTSPQASAKLTINASSTTSYPAIYLMHSTAADGNQAAIQYLDQSGASTWGITAANVSDSAATADFMVITRTAGNAFIIEDGGNVGIGTMAPAQKLDIRGGFIRVSSTNGGIVYGYNDSGTLQGALSFGTSYDAADIGDTILESNIAGDQLFIVNNGGGAGGGVYLNQGDTAWNANSDERLKTNIEPLSDLSGIEAIKKLTPVSFNWKDVNQNAAQGKQLGLIAQKVQQVFPEIVTDGGTATVKLENNLNETINNTLGLNYDGLIPPMIKAIQEQQLQIEALQSENGALKGLICLDHPQASICAI